MDTSSPFSRLPRDCWEIIVQHLSFKDLASVSRTCRSLRVSTEHLLYRNITWSWNSLPLRRLLRLLRTILERPDLALKVERVSLVRMLPTWFNLLENPKEYDMDWEREPGLGCFAAVVEKAVEIVQRAQLFPMAEWIWALQNGNFYAFVAVFISRVPNVKSLCLDFSFIYRGGYPGRMMEHAILSSPDDGVLPTFTHLEWVDYGGNVSDSEPSDPGVNDGFLAPFNHDQFAGWFYLPSLKRLEIWLRDTARFKERPPDLSNLHTLVLARSTIPEEDVPLILSRTTSLRNLHLGLAYSYYYERVFQRADCIAHALESVSNTVERLSVGIEHYPIVFGNVHSVWSQPVRYDRVQETLKKFTRLQTAELPLSLLINYEDYHAYILGNVDVDLSATWPDTLREVGLREDMMGPHESLWDELSLVDWTHDVLLKQRHTAVPHLQRISIRNWWPNDENEIGKGDERRLRRKCEEDGISLDIVADALSRGLWAQSFLEES